MADRLVRSKTVYQASGTTISATFDETAALDGTYLLVAAIHLGSSTVISAPSGWTEVTGGGSTSTSQTRMYVKQGNGTVNGVTITVASAAATLIISAYSGFVSLTPLWSQGGAGANSSSFTSTSPAGYSYGVALAAIGLSATATWGSWTNATRVGSIVNASQRLDLARIEYTGGEVTATINWSGGSRTPRVLGAIMPLKATLSAAEMEFSFDGETGSDAYDSTGHGYPFWGITNRTSGHTGGDIVSTATAPAAISEELSIPGNSPRTWMLWAKLDSIPSSGEYASLMSYQMVSAGGGTALFVDHTGVLGSGGSNTGSTIQWEFFTATPVMSAGTWYHVALVYNDVASLASLYLNGVLVASTAILDVPADIETIRLGGHETYTYAGQHIDDFRQFNVSLSQWEIQSFMATPVLPIASIPIVYGIQSGGIVGNGSFTVEPPEGAPGYIAIISYGTSTPAASEAPEATPPEGFTLFASGYNSYTVWQIYIGTANAGSTWQTSVGWSASVMVIALSAFEVEAYGNGGEQNAYPTPDQTTPALFVTEPSLIMRIMTAAPWPGEPTGTWPTEAPNNQVQIFTPNGDEGSMVLLSTSNQGAVGSTGTAAFNFTPLDGSTVHTLALKALPNRTISYVDTAWDTTGTGTGDGTTKYKQVTLTDCQVGDVIVAFGATENLTGTGGTRYIWDVTAGGVKTGAWTTTTGLTGFVDGDVDFFAAYAVVTAAGSITVQLGLRFTSNNFMGVGAYVIPAELVTGSYGFVGSGFSSDTDGQGSVTLSSSSTVIYMGADWVAQSMGTTPTPAGGVVLRSHSDSAYGVWTALWENQSTGTRNYGPSGLSGRDVTGIIFTLGTTSTPTTSRWFLSNGTALTPYHLTGGGLVELE